MVNLMANRSSGYDKCFRCTGIFRIEDGYDLEPVKGESKKDFVCNLCIGPKVKDMARRYLVLEEALEEKPNFDPEGTNAGKQLYEEGFVDGYLWLKRKVQEALKEE